jgi:hypothetical protein
MEHIRFTGITVADFEKLIRGAILAKNAESAQERAAIYQSSRNALARLIETNRSMTVETALKEQQSLEDSIQQIEYEFTAPPPPPEPPQEEIQEPVIEQPVVPEAIDPYDQPEQVEIPEPVFEELSPQEPSPQEHEQLAPAPKPIPQPVRSDPFSELEEVLGADMQRYEQSAQPQVETPAAQPDLQAQPKQAIAEPQVPPVAEPAAPHIDQAQHVDQGAVEYDTAPEQSDHIELNEDVRVPPAFAKRRKSQKTFIWIIVLLAILAVVAWIGYRLFLGVTDGSLFGFNSGNRVTTQEEQARQQEDYFNILEPGDLTALVVSDRGRVEIINEQSLEMIRILSLRDSEDRAEQAEPILIRLKPGVIEQIRGKRVTAEIFARSGKSGPAQFAVECMFGQNIGCGRKRFRIGVQPEASVFAFTLDKNHDTTSKTYIALNTDITDNASITGEGDTLDIVYVRLRAQE